MINLREAYFKTINANVKSTYIKSSNFSEKPIMYTGFLSTESTMCIQPAFGVEFKLDKEGMQYVLAVLENKLNSHTEQEQKNLITLLNDVYSITEEYLGGHGVQSIRSDAYLNSENQLLTMSQIKGKNIGLCIERSAIAHEMLMVLNHEEIIKSYSSYLTNSHLTVNGNRSPHAFIILKNRNPEKGHLLFDIENPIEFCSDDSETSAKGIAVYSMSNEELETFQNGEAISLQSLYEKFGYQLIGEKRFYGDTVKERNDGPNLDD